MATSSLCQRLSRRIGPTQNEDADADYFDLPVAQLPKGPRPILALSSSSDEDDRTSSFTETDDDPDTIPDDMYAHLRKQLSSLNVESNFPLGRYRSTPIFPSKYLFDESGRRWSTNPTMPGNYESLPPRPKHQDGKLKCSPQSSACSQSPLSCWQYFMPDSFLERYAMVWLDNGKVNGVQAVNSCDGDADRNGLRKGRRGKGRVANGPVMENQVETSSLDELKAFFAILYARIACADQSTSMGAMWRADPFTPSFFIGTMKKETFFKILKDIMGLGKNELPPAASTTSINVPAFVTDFNYRATQAFDPGDTLVVIDQIRNFNVRNPCPSADASTGEKTLKMRGLTSWLRDGRNGFFLKTAATTQRSPSDDMIVDNEITANPMNSGEIIRYLVSQPPISGSGRTIYTGTNHTSAEIAAELYEKHKLRLVGRLPSAGFYDLRIPFLAKSRSLFKRVTGSSLFLFDYPLAVISYQHRPPGRTPDVLVSTAHYSKVTTDCADQISTNSGRPPPEAWVEYQHYMNNNASNSTMDFCGLLARTDEIEMVPMERRLFLDCLFATAFNAYIIWKLQDEKRRKWIDLNTFLKILATELAKAYVIKRLSEPANLENYQQTNWRTAAKHILEECEDADGTGNSVGKKVTNGEIANAVGMGNENGSVTSTHKQQEKKQTKKRGKQRR